MIGSLYDACVAISALLRSVNGIKQAPDLMVEKPTQFPFAGVYPRQGTFDLYAGTVKRGLHQIVIEIHVSRRDLQHDLTTVVPLLERVVDALMNAPTLGGLANALVMDSDQPIRYELTPMEYNAIQTLGYRLTISVKQETVIQ